MEKIYNFWGNDKEYEFFKRFLNEKKKDIDFSFEIYSSREQSKRLTFKTKDEDSLKKLLDFCAAWFTGYYDRKDYKRAIMQQKGESIKKYVNIVIDEIFMP